MRKHEFVLFYAGLPDKERDKPACLLTYRQVWKMLEVFKEDASVWKSKARTRLKEIMKHEKEAGK